MDIVKLKVQVSTEENKIEISTFKSDTTDDTIANSYWIFILYFATFVTFYVIFIIFKMHA